MVRKRLVDDGHDPAFIETTFEKLAPGVDANGFRVTLHNALPARPAASSTSSP